MRVLRLYDLKSGKVTVVNSQKGKNSNNKEFRKGETRWKKFSHVFLLTEAVISFLVGLFFWIGWSEMLKEERGCNAIGSELLAAIMVAFGVFLLLEQIRDWIR